MSLADLGLRLERTLWAIHSSASIASRGGWIRDKPIIICSWMLEYITNHTLDLLAYNNYINMIC